MPAPISTFIDVNVNITGALADKFQFGAVLGAFAHNVNTDRQNGPFFNETEMNDAGFTVAATPAIRTWASDVFAQDDGVDFLLVGRRIPPTGGIIEQVWQVAAIGPVFVDETTDFNSVTTADWDVFPAGNAIGDYSAWGMPEKFSRLLMDNTSGTAGTVGVVDWEYWDGSAWSALVVVDGTSSFTAAVSSGQLVTWTPPLDWTLLSLNGETAQYYVRAVITTIFTIEPIYDVGTAAGDQTWTETLDEIETANSESWYITNIESRAAADTTEAANWTETRAKIYMGQSSDSDILSDGGGNIAETLNGLSLTRTALWYHALDAEYLDGAIGSSGGGLNLDAPGGVGIWGFRQLESITPDTVTGAQATNIYANAANLFGRNIGLSFTSEGTMAAGKPRFIDVTTTIDWVTKRIQEAVLELFVGTPTKIPYTNGGINLCVGAIQGVFDAGVTFGHFSPDTPPTITAPDINDVSSTNKQNRVLQLTANAVFAGAIQKIELTINLQF